MALDTKIDIEDENKAEMAKVYVAPKDKEDESETKENSKNIDINMDFESNESEMNSYFSENKPSGPACLAHAMQKINFIQLYCGPKGPRANIFIEIWIKQSGAMVLIFNLDKVWLKKLCPTMNI